MAFRDYQKHYTECKYGEPCGKYHLYLMKLNPTIKRKKRFKEANPDYVEGQPLYYVGKTKHHPRCRQSMHQTYKKNRPSEMAKLLPGLTWKQRFRRILAQPLIYCAEAH